MSELHWEAFHRGEIAEALARTPDVRWDRFVSRVGEVIEVYGWLDRPDGRSDFVLARFSAVGALLGKGFVTSSAERSRELTEQFFGYPTPHFDCERVEYLFSEEELPNVVRSEFPRERPISEAPCDHDCANCGEAISAGETVALLRPGGPYVHERCAEEEPWPPS